MRIAFSCLVLVLFAAGCGTKSVPEDLPPTPVLSPNAPKDQLFDARGMAKEFDAAIAPYVEKSRKTYPEAKARFLAGLPKDHHFLAVTKLGDGSGTTEQVFVAVNTINDGRIVGRIAT